MIHPPSEDSDEWVFDTVKPMAPSATIRNLNTSKRRKVSTIQSFSNNDVSSSLQALTLKDAPLHGSSPATIRRATIRRVPSLALVKQRGSSGTHRGSPNPRARDPSTPRARMVSQKRPLQPSISFGNSPSTVRVFRRVPSDKSTAGVVGTGAGIDSAYCSEAGSVADSVKSNSPQAQDGKAYDHTMNTSSLIEATTREGILGRRAFSKVLDPAFQQLHAQTSNHAAREAISNLAQAFSALDAVDPEGELQFLRTVFDKISFDAKLSSAISGTNATASPHTPGPAGTPSTPKQKLVISQNNPHLRSLRKKSGHYKSDDRAGGFAGIDENRFPGREVAGMEHTKQLADVLYGRWVDGLKVRWPDAA